MSEFDPRFGGKFRTVVRSATPATMSELRSLFTRHIVSGCLLPGYAIECGLQQPLPRHPDMANEASLFEQWVPLIFSAAGAPEFDGDMVELYGREDYATIKHLWARPFGQPIADCLAQLGIPLGDEERRMIANYFNAGLVLRCVEANALSG